jgi:hypothetical protein
VSRERVQFQCGLDHEVHQEFLRVQNLVSQNQQSHADREETLKELISFYRKHKDPILKAERAHSRNSQSELRKPKPALGPGQVEMTRSKPTLGPGQVKRVQPRCELGLGQAKKPRQYPAALKHEINLRDQSQCTHIDSSGSRCEERRWLSFHHKIEVSKGGRDTLGNLTTLCFAHHKLIHIKNKLSDHERPYVH